MDCKKYSLATILATQGISETELRHFKDSSDTVGISCNGSKALPSMSRLNHFHHHVTRKYLNIEVRRDAETREVVDACDDLHEIGITPFSENAKSQHMPRISSIPQSHLQRPVAHHRQTENSSFSYEVPNPKLVSKNPKSKINYGLNSKLGQYSRIRDQKIHGSSIVDLGTQFPVNDNGRVSLTAGATRFIWLHKLYQDDPKNPGYDKTANSSIILDLSEASTSDDESIEDESTTKSTTQRTIENETRPQSAQSIGSDLVLRKDAIQREVQPSPTPWSDYAESAPSRPTSSRRQLRFERHRPNTSHLGHSSELKRKLRDTHKKRPFSSPAKSKEVGLSDFHSSRSMSRSSRAKSAAANSVQRIPLCERNPPKRESLVRPKSGQQIQRPVSNLSIRTIDGQTEIHSCLRTATDHSSWATKERKCTKQHAGSTSNSSKRHVSILPVVITPSSAQVAPTPCGTVRATSHGWLL